MHLSSLGCKSQQAILADFEEDGVQKIQQGI